MNLSALRHLQEGSIWIDANERTIVVWRVHWANTVSVASYELLLIPSMELVKCSAAAITQSVRGGKMQFCRFLKKEY
jgi:hypothetical protein